MKIILFVFFATLQLSAATTNAQVTLKKKNIRIEEALLEIRKQTGVDFFYPKAGLEKSRPVSINVENATVGETLDILLEGQNMSYTLKDGIVTISPSASTQVINVSAESTSRITAGTQQVYVTGVVRDQNGAPLPLVNIESYSASVRNVGQQSDANGAFRVPVSSLRDTLRFTRIGYQPLVIAINNRTEVVAVMREAIEAIEDVVVTGIYERRADSYTGAVQTIGKDQLRQSGTNNLFQALKNISPSMVLDNFEMGSNPNVLPDLQIRGNGSLPIQDGEIISGLKGNYLKDPTQPLFILDGFEASVERIFDLDLNRIESVTILKDAASKALYGSKAANGVIVIETTRQSSDKPIVNYNATMTFELPDLTSYNLTNSRQKLEAEVIDGMYIPNNNTFPADYFDLFQLYNSRKKLVDEGLNTHWIAKPLQNGIGQRHALSIDLGNRDLRVLTDVNYNEVKGVMIGSGRRNIGGSVNASYRLHNLLFRNIASVNSNKGYDSPYGTFSEYSRMNPYWRAENEDGTIPYYAELFPINMDPITNPLYNSTLNTKLENSYLNFVNNFYLEWTVFPGLKTTLRTGIDVKRNDADEFYPSKHTRFEHLTQSWVSDEERSRAGSYQVNTGKGVSFSGDVNVNYSKEINSHYFFANVGYNLSERSYNERIYQAEGFPSDRLQDIMFARGYTLDTRPQGIDGLVRDMGFLTAFSYMWDNRFLSDFTYRTNASSQFGADRRWASFWSLGLGWNLHNEAWARNAGWIDQLRLRGSLGETGNQNFNTNASIATYRYIIETFYQGFPGSVLQNMANSALQWESAFDYNAGLDLKMGRLGLRFDYYERYTDNLLTDISLPGSTGFTSVKDNLGRVKNHGVEAYANLLLFQHGSSFLSLNGSIETNESKIIELSNALKTFNTRMDAIAADQGNNRPVHKYVDGMSMDAIWAVPSRGIDPATGLEIYVDRDGNTTHLWNANDMIVAGVARPKYQGTIGLNGEYKGFGFAVTARYLGGGQLYNQTLVDRVENVDMNYNVDARVLTGRWRNPGDQVLYKRLGEYFISLENGSTTTGQAMTRATTRFVQDRNELAIGSLNVYYDFPRANWLNAASLERLRLSFNMNEVGTFSSIQLERGLSYPFARTMSFSLNATF